MQPGEVVFKTMKLYLCYIQYISQENPTETYNYDI